MRRTAVSVILVIVALLHTQSDLNAQNVNAFMTKVAEAWARGDVDAITAAADPAGIALEVEGTHVGAITSRQAGAVLRKVFEDRETIRATAGAVKVLPGKSSRAYAEIVWERRSRGTTQPEHVNVFVALARDGNAWRITEIRLMR